MSVGNRPFAAYHFYVEMQSVTQALFAECSGLQIETEVYEYKEGGNNTHVHRLPGRAKMGNISLKRGITRPGSSTSGPWNNDLWKWYSDVLQGKIQRHNLSIILFDTNGGERVATWNIIEAYPIKWVGPTFKAGEQVIAIEQLDLAHRGVQLV